MAKCPIADCLVPLTIKHKMGSSQAKPSLCQNWSKGEKSIFICLYPAPPSFFFFFLKFFYTFLKNPLVFSIKFKLNFALYYDNHY